MKSETAATLEALEPQALSIHAFREACASAGEQTHLDVYRRVAKALGRDIAQEQRFLSTLVKGFLPGAGINASAGLDRNASLVSCFVQPLADCMTGELHGFPGIMDALGQAAETMRRGSGVSYDFSPLRPSRARVRGLDAEASGPVSYMRVFDCMCDAVGSAGAQMGVVLRIDHPDIEMYIEAKKGPDFTAMGLSDAMADQLMQTNSQFGAAIRRAFAALDNVNISVGVTDKFMQAVLDDADFDLVHMAEPGFSAFGELIGEDGLARFVYGTVRARDLWAKLLHNAYERGGPGIVFLDTIRRRNNLRDCESVSATSPCGQPLPPYGCCDEGYANLVRFVRHPFTTAARFDWDAFKQVVAGGVELLDRVQDVTMWPLPHQQAEAEAKRRIGVGITGLASAMAMLGLRYGSLDSAVFAGEVARTMRDTAYRKSVELARELGPFPFFDADKYLEEGTFASSLPEDIKEDIRRDGVRNSHLLSLPMVDPEWSLAFGANSSCGIEPIIELAASRNVRTGNGDELKLGSAEEYALRMLKLVRGEGAKDDALVTAQELSEDDHLRVVSAVSPYIDGAVSKVVHAPREYTLEVLQATCMSAWRSGVKGVAVNAGICG